MVLGSAVGAAIAGPGYQLGWWELSTALRVVLQYSVYGLLAAGGIGFVLALILIALPPRDGWVAPLLGALIAAAVAYVPVTMARTAADVPRIHDISTDLGNPPPFVDLLALREGARNPPDHPGSEVAAQQQASYPDIKPVLLAASPDRTFAEAILVATSLGWDIVAQVPEEGRIEATQTSFWFGFTDDIVIRIEETETGSRLDIRSKSRVGQSDIGANAARIRAFTAALTAQLDASASP